MEKSSLLSSAVPTEPAHTRAGCVASPVSAAKAYFARFPPGIWRAMLLGQVISLLIAGTGIASQYLSNANVHIPTAQSTLNYLLLSMILVRKVVLEGRSLTFKVRSRGGSCRDDCCLKSCANHGGTAAWGLAQVAPWKYAALAIADVEANYFVVKAYSYTSITSVMLLDCFTIPCVMVLSFVFLKAKVRCPRQHPTTVTV